jgi:flagellar motor switch protein FliG
MSKRAAERVREDLELLGAVRLADVEAAQQEIVEIALRLAAEGTLTLGGGGKGDEYV